MRPVHLLALVVVLGTGCGLLKRGNDAGADATTEATAATEEPTATAEPTPSATVDAVVDAGPPVLSGPCVNPEQDAKKRWGNGGDVHTDAQDLDGDGKKDKIITFGLGSMNDPAWVYLTRGTCGHMVAELNGAVTVSSLRSRGVKSLLVFNKSPCFTECGCVNLSTTYNFTGKSYTAGKVKEEPINAPCDAGAPKDAGRPVDAGKPAPSSSAATNAKYKVGDKVMITWKNGVYPGVILSVVGDKYKIHYDNYGSNWDEVVGTDRLRRP